MATPLKEAAQVVEQDMPPEPFNVEPNSELFWFLIDGMILQSYEETEA